MRELQTVPEKDFVACQIKRTVSGEASTGLSGTIRTASNLLDVQFIYQLDASSI